ncbi:MAG: hypothetical protein K1X65_17180 [Caldilineales bacterium]|nr:hypothetical protein [Caldilineales bacterium]MCW5857126.1 hypothetical protein [Caldilineales bacterium]
MQARILALFAAYGDHIARLVPVHVEDEYLKLVIYFADGSNLRVAEEWNGGVLSSYSYYWLSADDSLKIGWDNAPHHRELEHFPHHKHIGRQENRFPSAERRLEDVMRVILAQMNAPDQA